MLTKSQREGWAEKKQTHRKLGDAVEIMDRNKLQMKPTMTTIGGDLWKNKRFYIHFWWHHHFFALISVCLAFVTFVRSFVQSVGRSFIRSFTACSFNCCFLGKNIISFQWCDSNKHPNFSFVCIFPVELRHNVHPVRSYFSDNFELYFFAFFSRCFLVCLHSFFGFRWERWCQFSKGSGEVLPSFDMGLIMNVVGEGEEKGRKGCGWYVGNGNTSGMPFRRTARCDWTENGALDRPLERSPAN